MRGNLRCNLHYPPNIYVQSQQLLFQKRPQYNTIISNITLINILRKWPYPTEKLIHAASGNCELIPRWHFRMEYMAFYAVNSTLSLLPKPFCFVMKFYFETVRLIKKYAKSRWKMCYNFLQFPKFRRVIARDVTWYCF